MVTIAIQGFGRIGRTFLRVLLADPHALAKIRVAVINIGPAKPESVLHSFKYDSLMGTYQEDVTYQNGMLLVGGQQIVILHEVDITRIAWGAFGVEWVIDCSGCATHREKAE